MEENGVVKVNGKLVFLEKKPVLGKKARTRVKGKKIVMERRMGNDEKDEPNVVTLDNYEEKVRSSDRRIKELDAARRGRRRVW